MNTKQRATIVLQIFLVFIIIPTLTPVLNKVYSIEFYTSLVYASITAVVVSLIILAARA